MKKTFTLLAVVLILAISLSACTAPENKVLNSLGEYKSHEFYTEGAFQDYTDYAKYYYDSVDFTDNEYFTKIEQYDTNNLSEYLDNFESFIELYRENDASREIVVNYDFNRTLIDENDYVYIYSKPYNFDDVDYNDMKFYNYEIYFFDTQTNTLYYFHNNI